VEKISLRQVIVCEGKYDAIRLSSLFDTLILPTHGFQVYSNIELRTWLKKLAEQRGLVIVTDSDSAGFQIRAYLKSFIPDERLQHVYIPDVLGKEPRKVKPASEGKLGVEGIQTKALLDAFERTGLLKNQAPLSVPLSRLVLYRDGFSGTSGAKARYQQLLKALGLPGRLSVNHFCACVSQEEYDKAKERLCV